jgi:hypothetical protein
MLQAFVDESLARRGPRLFVLAGFIAPAKTWRDFSDEWQQCAAPRKQVALRSSKSRSRTVYSRAFGSFPVDGHSLSRAVMSGFCHSVITPSCLGDNFSSVRLSRLAHGPVRALCSCHIEA